MQKDTFKIVVHYREPGYEARVGAKAEPYRWTYRIHADSEEEAVRDARRQFAEMAYLSGVGWAREVVDIEIHPTREGEA